MTNLFIYDLFLYYLDNFYRLSYNGDSKKKEIYRKKLVKYIKDELVKLGANRRNLKFRFLANADNKKLLLKQYRHFTFTIVVEKTSINTRAVKKFTVLFENEYTEMLLSNTTELQITRMLKLQHIFE